MTARPALAPAGPVPRASVTSASSRAIPASTSSTTLRSWRTWWALSAAISWPLSETQAAVHTGRQLLQGFVAELPGQALDGVGREARPGGGQVERVPGQEHGRPPAAPPRGRTRAARSASGRLPCCAFRHKLRSQLERRRRANGRSAGPRSPRRRPGCCQAPAPAPAALAPASTDQRNRVALAHPPRDLLPLRQGRGGGRAAAGLVHEPPHGRVDHLREEELQPRGCGAPRAPRARALAPPPAASRRSPPRRARPAASPAARGCPASTRRPPARSRSRVCRRAGRDPHGVALLRSASRPAPALGSRHRRPESAPRSGIMIARPNGPERVPHPAGDGHDGEDRRALQAPRVRVPLLGDLRRRRLDLRLRPLRGAAQEQPQERVVAGDAAGARRHRRDRLGDPPAPPRVGGVRAPRGLHRPAGGLPHLQAALPGRPPAGAAVRAQTLPPSRRSRRVRPDPGAGLQPHVRDHDRAGEGVRVHRLPAPRDRPGDLHQLQERAAVLAQETALRDRPGGQVLPQRDHPRELHLQDPRVRADGDGVLRAAAGGPAVVRALAGRARALVRGARHPARLPAAAAPTTPTSCPTTPRAPATSSTCSPPAPTRRTGAGRSSRGSPTAATSTSPATPSSRARSSSTSTRPPASATSRT